MKHPFDPCSLFESISDLYSNGLKHSALTIYSSDGFELPKRLLHFEEHVSDKIDRKPDASGMLRFIECLIFEERSNLSTNDPPELACNEQYVGKIGTFYEIDHQNRQDGIDIDDLFIIKVGPWIAKDDRTVHKGDPMRNARLVISSTC